MKRARAWWIWVLIIIIIILAGIGLYILFTNPRAIIPGPGILPNPPLPPSG